MSKTLLAAVPLSLSVSCYGQLGDPSYIDDPSFFIKNPPSLGGGFDHESNRFSGSCMDFKRDENRPVTANFDYNFIKVDEEYFNSLTTNIEVDARFKYWFLKTHINFKSDSSSSTRMKKKYILVEYQVETLYDSIDDTQSSFYPDALRLISNNNLDLFLTTCGDHYVRSIGRTKTYFALLSYETENTNRDSTFEGKLEANLSGLFARGRFTGTVDRELEQEAISKRLQIRIQGRGLSLDELNPNILPMSLEEFPTAIRTTIETMKDPDTGIITRVEVAPWTYNTRFIERVIEANPGNPEFANRTLNFIRNSATKAKAFRRAELVQNLESEFINCVDDFQFSKVFNPDDTTKYINHLDLSQSAESKVLDTLLTYDKVDSLQLKIDEFVYSDQTGVSPCLEHFSTDANLWGTTNVRECRGRNVRIPNEIMTLFPVLERYCPIEVSNN
ncbi:hypothetical protein [Pseudobacteriovorax antillogorgiicola]|nr:hypothetical protein [Pseudobacteriovorax antillogorgiicola]